MAFPPAAPRPPLAGKGAASPRVSEFRAARTPLYQGFEHKLSSSCRVVYFFIYFFIICGLPPVHPNVKHELIDMVGALPVSAGVRAHNLMLSIDNHGLDLFTK